MIKYATKSCLTWHYPQILEKMFIYSLSQTRILPVKKGKNNVCNPLNAFSLESFTKYSFLGRDRQNAA